MPLNTVYQMKPPVVYALPTVQSQSGSFLAYQRRPSLGHHLAEVELAIGSLDHSAFLRHDSIDQVMWRDVECRIPYSDPLVRDRDSLRPADVDGSVWSDNGTADLGKLLPLALLDFDSRPVSVARSTLVVGAATTNLTP